MMRRREAGGVGVLVLGVVLMLLLLVGGLGLVEMSRAKVVRSHATVALTAAVQSASRAPVGEQQALFMSVLRENLQGETDYRAELRTGPGEVTGRLELAYRLAYIGRWAPPIPLVVTHSEPVLKRKPRP
ncbi:MAG TPA: hypothetical protein VNT75_17830 [Symbiobacteriaceae bacterium]|nr:hypothetical protein [Symbiobacteriaceae bacterium]